METTPLMQFLKEETRSKHTQAEGHPFQGELAQGRLPYGSYCRYLGYLYSLHNGFESMLAQSGKTNADIAAVMTPELYQVPFLTDDLQELKLQVPTQPAASITKFLASPTFEKYPVSLLGVLYVLLGSKHGAKFIANSVKQAYGLNGGGYKYFDPYGSEFRSLWQDFIARMNALNLDAAERGAMLDAARATFDVFGEIGEDIWQWQQTQCV